jgi:hypothetical protein
MSDLKSELNEAVEIRKEISFLYKEYRKVSACIFELTSMSHIVFKRTVDAIHYLGGGWPSKNSLGRMESCVKSFAELFHSLSFIERESLIVKELAKYGLTISVNQNIESKFTDMKLTKNDFKYIETEYAIEFTECETSKELTKEAVSMCNDLQTDICKLADKLKLEYKESIQLEYEIEEPEYIRLFKITKIKNNKKNMEKKLTAIQQKYKKSISVLHKNE